MAKPIMIQGTTSNAGKSIICAALCRIFFRKGWRVVPFKSQNMALNSFVTNDGLEMGRAQVLQAQAAGVAPDVRMNPILLKPTTDVGSQVIVNGTSRGNFPAKEYFKMKTSLIPDILSAYGSLSVENDIIVIEGAGSPAEINLKKNDIVNMGLAGMVDAPVLLVADIDPGGVFASLYGTVALLEPEERKRIKGFIINKFRGDSSILESGLRMLEDLTSIPVVGVIPYINLDLDDEDSLTQRFGKKTHTGDVDIAVIHLPRISNFTDFNPLERMPEVNLRYVRSASQLGAPDLVIIPGTKSTISDLKWLNQSGFSDKIRRYARFGGAVVGICGGYQMLGKTVTDLNNSEGGGVAEGLGLLDMTTEFQHEKKRTRVYGKVKKIDGFFSEISDYTFFGYEIHMGHSEQNSQAFSVLSDGRQEGGCIGNIWGSYVHGIFDDGDFAAAFVNCLLRNKGLPETAESIDWADYQNKQLDVLADEVEKALNMEFIERIMGVSHDGMGTYSSDGH